MRPGIGAARGQGAAAADEMAQTAGARLRARRRALGLSQAGLAGVLGVTANTVARWERGEQRLRQIALVDAALDRLAASAPTPDAASASLQALSPVASSPASVRVSIPAELSSLVGREESVRLLTDLLGRSRLLTLTGPGGVGKTRLALRLAADAAGGYPDGVHLVQLAGLSEPELVPQAVASSIGVAERHGRSPSAALAEWSRTKRALLVLDNCEHLVGACADLAHLLLRACPELRILATSRAPLGVDGETTWLVPPLSLGEPGAPVEEQAQSAAVRLLAERAKAVWPEFALTDDNAQTAVAICRALEGIPLAIELAAARLQMLGPRDLLGRLRQGLSVLAGGSRAAPARQRTMRAAVDWSYGLLDEHERRLFERVSVFAGGWTLEAAEAVCAGDSLEETDVLDSLGALVDRSLVVVEPHAAQHRYRLLEPLRQYAAERLAERGPAEVARVRDRHAAYCLALARRSFAPLFEGSAAELRSATSQQPGGLERLERDHDNVRAALGWLLESSQAAEAQRLGAAFCPFWEMRGHFAEGRAWLGRILDLSGGDRLTRIRVLFGAGFLAFTSDDPPSASRCDEEALRLAREAGDDTTVALALYRLGADARARGELAKAHALLGAALDASETIGNSGLQAQCRLGLANLAIAEGDLEQARTLLADALGRFREVGNRREAAITARRLGVTLYRLGDRAAGRSLLEEGVAALRGLGDRWQVAMALWELGAASINEGDLARAWDLLSDGLRLARDLGDRGRICWYLQGFAHLAAAQGQPHRALLLASAASTLGERSQPDGSGESRPDGPDGWWWSVMGLPSVAGEYSVLANELRSAKVRLGERRASEASSAGRSLSVDEAIARALTPETASPPIVDGRPPLGLTARELEVVCLAAEGRTNTQIAETLVLSSNTVKRHFDNVFAKLSVSSRAAAIAAVLQSQLASDMA